MMTWLSAAFGLLFLLMIILLWMWIPFSPHHTILAGFAEGSVFLPYLISALVFRYLDLSLMVFRVKSEFPYDDADFRVLGGYMRMHALRPFDDETHKTILSNLSWARLFAILPYVYLYGIVAFTFYVCTVLLQLSGYQTPLFLNADGVGIVALLFFTLHETLNVLSVGALEAYGLRLSGLVPNADCLILGHLLFSFRLFVAASAGAAAFYWFRYWLVLYEAPDERSMFYDEYQEIIEKLRSGTVVVVGQATTGS